MTPEEQTAARLEAVYREAKKDEATLKRILEQRRKRRRERKEKKS